MASAGSLGHSKVQKEKQGTGQQPCFRIRVSLCKGAAWPHCFTLFYEISLHFYLQMSLCLGYTWKCMRLGQGGMRLQLPCNSLSHCTPTLVGPLLGSGARVQIKKEKLPDIMKLPF